MKPLTMRCHLVHHRDGVVDRHGFTTTIDPEDPVGSLTHLRARLAEAIRAEGLSPARVGHEYHLDVARDIPGATASAVHLTDTDPQEDCA